MGEFFKALKTSSLNVARPITNPLPKPPGTSRSVSSGRTLGSSEESNNETQQPHDALDAIIMYTRALQTSLWKIWLATILFPQLKANGNEEWRLTQ